MYQKIIFVGNIVRNPELRFTADGTAVTTVAIAVDDSYTNQAGEKVTKTAFVNVDFWRRRAEVIAEYKNVGDEVLVECKLKGQVTEKTAGSNDQTIVPRVWTGRDGEPRASYEFTGLNMVFLRGRGKGSGGGSTPVDPATAGAADFDPGNIDF